MRDAYEFLDSEEFPFSITENGNWYKVAIRPLLPFEIPTSQPWNAPKFEEFPTVPMTCDASAR